MSEEVTKDMIGCLCYFGFRHTIGYWHLGVLKNVVELKNCKKIYYINEFNEQYDKIKPVKSNEVKFYDYDDRYNCCVENEVLRLKIVKLENDIKTANKNAQHWFDVAREKAEENIKLIEKIEELKNE